MVLGGGLVLLGCAGGKPCGAECDGSTAYTRGHDCESGLDCSDRNGKYICMPQACDRCTSQKCSFDSADCKFSGCYL